MPTSAFDCSLPLGKAAAEANANARIHFDIEVSLSPAVAKSDFISAPANERAEAFATMTAYAGRYTFTGKEVVHHVEAASMPNDVGTDLKRSVTLDGDRLVLLVANPYLRGGIMVRSQELVWKRIK